MRYVHGNIVVDVDKMAIIPVNEREVLQALGPHLSGMIRKRVLLGVSSSGRRLPTPKDAGKPWNPSGRALFRSGQLAGSIDHYVDSAKVRVRKRWAYGSIREEDQQMRRWVLYVSALGQRDHGDGEYKRRMKLLRLRSKKRRVAIVLGHLFRGTSPGKVELRREFKSARTRTGTTNASVASILSVKPTDKNSKAGRRGVYRVIELTNSEAAFANNFVRHRIAVRLARVETDYLGARKYRSPYSGKDRL